jgi:hypothetical protein
MICLSSSNTHQLVMLSGINGLNNNSTENALGEKPSTCNNFEMTLANKSTSKLLDLRMELMLKVRKLHIKPHTLVW